jgi:hypothetical protein
MSCRLRPSVASASHLGFVATIGCLLALWSAGSAAAADPTITAVVDKQLDLSERQRDSYFQELEDFARKAIWKVLEDLNLPREQIIAVERVRETDCLSQATTAVVDKQSGFDTNRL